MVYHQTKKIKQLHQKTFLEHQFDNILVVEIKSLEENNAEIEVNGTSYQVQLGQEIKRPQTPKLVRYTPPTPLKPPQPLNIPGLSIVKALGHAALD